MGSLNQFYISYLVLVSFPDQISFPRNDNDGGSDADSDIGGRLDV